MIFRTSLHKDTPEPILASKISKRVFEWELHIFGVRTMMSQL